MYPGSPEQVPTNTMFYKYLNTKPKRAVLGFTDNIESGMKDYRDWPVNYPVLRFEDVLLMYAELLADEGNTTGAVGIVNRIRSRAGCDVVSAASASEAMNLIKDERRLELFGEGVRWFDLVRWNEWQQTILDMFHAYSNPPGSEDSNVKDGRYLYPIPMNQINVKPGLYQQNTGY